MFTWNRRQGRRMALLSCSTLVAAATAGQALGQTAAERGSTLGEIVVTAQKREQSLQDVPVAITAMTQETLEANRIASVLDLSTLAPNMNVIAAAGSIGIPTFVIRGVASFGSVAGQDRQISVYLDGVAVGAAQGSAFDLPDLERIEVLRGPQGTLFGRNSTGGAISIITRDPGGEFRLRQAFTYGNYDQFRSVTRIETPTWGPLSASFSYTHDERTGDIKNIGAGARWDFSRVGMGTFTSPKTLGDKNSETWFAAVKFEPNDSFKTVYKYDRMTNHFTPEGTSVVTFTPEAGLGAATGGLVRAMYNANPFPIADEHRPKYVNNNWATAGYQRVYGHNVTSNIRVNDQLSLKNIIAYRKSYIYSNSSTTGAGGLINLFPALGAVGAPYLLFESYAQARSSQFSEELQLNYDSKYLTLTAGAVYFNLKTQQGPPDGFAANPSFMAFPGGVIPLGLRAQNFNQAKSLAGYGQAEIHVTPQLDVIAGYRLTHDKKTGVSIIRGIERPISYEKTKPSYLVGVNYQPTDEILAYGKYSTGFVSGGSVSGIPFPPETVRSWEGGVKTDLLDRRLRLNIAAFTAKYEHIQSVSSGQFIARPELGSVVLDQGDLKTKGFEVEVTATPFRGLTLAGNTGYTKYTFSNLNPILSSLGNVRLQYRPKWTADLSAHYESDPVFGEARLVAHVDGGWRSKVRMLGNFPTPPGLEDFIYSPSGWVVNGRVALKEIELPRGDLEIALWAKNLTDSDRIMFPINFNFLVSSSYERARTFGVDVIYNY